MNRDIAYFLGVSFFLLLLAGFRAHARGMEPYVGSITEFHARDLSAFDSGIGGNPLAVGGMGCADISDEICIGALGAGAMATNGKGQVEFGMGYGGMLGEYLLNSFLSARLLVGGGAFRVDRVSQKISNQEEVDKIRSGTFFLLQPSVNASFQATKWLKVSGTLGYFFPSVSELRGVTLGLSFFFS